VAADVEVRARLVATDHAFDALVSALVARDVAHGRADAPRSPKDLAQLGREGWIWMPRRKAELDESV
jgi:hypothetical protein